jgi:hypothetical protein
LVWSLFGPHPNPPPSTKSAILKVTSTHLSSKAKRARARYRAWLPQSTQKPPSTNSGDWRIEVHPSHSSSSLPAPSYTLIHTSLTPFRPIRLYHHPHPHERVSDPPCLFRGPRAPLPRRAPYARMYGKLWKPRCGSKHNGAGLVYPWLRQRTYLQKREER